MPPAALHAFVKVVRTGSFTREADALQTQKARESSVRLRERRTRALPLTEAGCDFFWRAHAILRSVDDARQAMQRAVCSRTCRRWTSNRRRRLQQACIAAKRQGAARLLQPNRSQIELRASDLESLLGEDHLARLVWGCVERQVLSRLTEAIKARGGNAGRAAIDPRMLFALWLYAVPSGVGSGREVARLTREHDAYRWICGGVSVNYHALNDFRSGNEALMDEVLTANVAALAAAGAISLERVAQDGMRVRADAGAASFRRAAALEQHLAEAGKLVREVKQRAKDDPGAGSRRAQAARPRTKRSASARRWSNCRRCRLCQAAQRRQARGGAHEHHGRRCAGDEDGRRRLRARVRSAVGNDQRKEGDSEPVAQWRARMASQEIKETGKQRAATAECVNALARNRGLQRLPVRGLGKVRAVAMLYALAHKLMRMVQFAPQLIGLGTGPAATALATAQGALEVRIALNQALQGPPTPPRALQWPDTCLAPSASARQPYAVQLLAEIKCLSASEASVSGRPR